MRNHDSKKSLRFAELYVNQLAQKMAKLREQRDNLQLEESTFTKARKARDLKSEKQQFIDKNRYVITLFIVFAMAIVVAQVGWILFGQQTNKGPIVQYDTTDPRYSNALNNPDVDQLEERISSLTANLQTLSGLLTNLESKLIATDQAEARIVSLNDNLERLNTMTSDLESKQKAVENLEERISKINSDLLLLSNLAAGIESEKKAALLTTASIVPATQKLASRTTTERPSTAKEAPVIQPQRTSAAANPEPKPAPTANPRNAPIERKESGVSKEPAARVTQNGPWALNLISSPDKAYAVSFSDTARSKGVITELQEVSVKGTPYWRVQVTGFSTQAEANASADFIQDQLGLTDIWVLKR
jgi:SPOR domain